MAQREHNPHACLGLVPEGDGWSLTCWLPQAAAVALLLPQGAAPMNRAHAAGVWYWSGTTPPDQPWRLRVDGIETHDAYAFPPEPPELALHLFNEGRNLQAHGFLGAHCTERMGVSGVVFRVWAPNAERVCVLGDFNAWDERRYPMASLGASGVWEIFVPGVTEGALYKYQVLPRNAAPRLKTDPYGRAFELRPANATRVLGPASHRWEDAAWMAARPERNGLDAPLAIYEVHLGSWRRNENGGFLSYRELAAQLIPYARKLGCTHLELLPICEHPLDESWGYQTTGYFAPTSRHGSPDDLRAFIDACHQAGLGVILDWTPGHFPEDDFALAHFDGSSLYEHEDPRLKHHPDWGTHVFNYGRREVLSFLLSSAYSWLAEFHFDGLRVDAVASMLYLDYSRKPGEWLPNRFGGRENLEAIDFLRELNLMVHREFPGALTIAEESTAWPMVSRPVHLGGLGFSLKWNMGWMNDTLAYLRQDPIHRRYHHNQLTFGQLYAYSENFLLPLSHDEVVHGKASLLSKMPGDDWQKFANLRLLLAYQFTTPGKKLLFMGGEIGQRHEWRAQEQIDWDCCRHPEHAGVLLLARDLFQCYRERAELHQHDCEAAGFQWSDCHDADHSVISFLRFARDGRHVLVVLNFTPVPRHEYLLGVPRPGIYRELLNTDSRHYGGSDLGNAGRIHAGPTAYGAFPASLRLSLPPLSGLVLCPE